MRSILVVVALAGLAHAAPKPKPKATVSPEAHKKYGELMKLGHKFQKSKDWKSAIGAFEKAVETVPDDPTALSELGWTAYLAKDLDKAEAATKRAVASDGAPNIRGAALYNLGLIDEARHDTKGAIAAYTASIKVRPHSVVRAALAKLDKAAAAALDPFAATAMGAITSPEDFCKPQSGDDDDGKMCTCTVKDLGKGTGGFQAIASLDRECLDKNGGSAGYEHHWIAAKREGKWFGTEMVSEVDESLRCSGSAVITAEAKGKRAIARIESMGICGNGENDHSWTVVSLVVLGTKGGVPASTPAFEVSRVETGNGDDVVIDLAQTWGKDGTLTLAGKTKGLDKEEAANTIGRHDLGLD